MRVNINSTTLDVNQSKASIQLLWIGIVSICMFFAGLTSVIFVDKMNFPESPDWFFYSTLAIIISSFLLLIASNRIKKDKSRLYLVISSFLMGILFTYFQFNGWEELTNNEVYFAGRKAPKEHSLLYALKGAHLAHLFAGLIALLITTIKIKKYNSTNYLGFKLASTYWHFLTILWIYLFFFLLISS
jgi:cytochrome c oxidase subunit 3